MKLQCLPTPRWVSIFCNSPHLTHFDDVSISVAMVTGVHSPTALCILLSRVLAQETQRLHRVPSSFPSSLVGSGMDFLPQLPPAFHPQVPALLLEKLHRIQIGLGWRGP